MSWVAAVLLICATYGSEIWVFLLRNVAIADDEEEKVGIIAEEVSKKQKGINPTHTTTHTCKPGGFFFSNM